MWKIWFEISNASFIRERVSYGYTQRGNFNKINSTFSDVSENLSHKVYIFKIRFSQFGLLLRI